MTTLSAQRVPATTVESALRVAGLGKRFGSVVALADVTLDVRMGAVHGLLGRNGAGKTTLLRTILRLVRPDTGTVHVLGRPASGAQALQGVGGFVEHPRFYPYLSAARNLHLLSSMDGRGVGPGVEAVLDAVGLRAQAHRKVGGLSSGMRQRLGIAAALLRDPSLLVLDEPTNGLDPTGVRDLHALIRDVAATGRTVLLSSHDMAEIENLCDSITVLRAGRVVFGGTIERLRAQAPAPSYVLTTSDDESALAVAHERVQVAQCPDGLVVSAHPPAMDDYVLRLGTAGVAVRSLTRGDTALEALFVRLTAPDAGGNGE